MELHIDDVAARTNVGDRLQQCRDGFLKRLAVQGYSSATIDVYGRLVRAQCSELTAQGLEIASHEAAAAATLAELAPEGSAAKTRALWKSVARRFVRYACELGVLDPSVPEAAPESDDLRHLRVAYGDWLRHQRGLSDNTVKNNLQVFNAFMRFRFTDEAIRPDRITPEDLVAFLVPERTERWTCLDRTKASRLRNFLRFLHWSGKVQMALVETVPRTSRRHMTTPRAHLEPGEVRRVLDAVRGDSALARRNYAILLLTGRLGLRAQEVVAIRLEDIRWRAGEILIRGKGNRHDPMPLPVDVGEALVDLHPPWQKRNLSSLVRHRPGAVAPVQDRSHCLSGARRCVGDGRAQRFAASPRCPSAPSLLGNEDAAPGSLLRRDRRCAAPSASCDDARLRSL